MADFEPLSLPEQQQIGDRVFPLAYHYVGEAADMVSAVQAFDPTLRSEILDAGVIMIRGLPLPGADAFETFLNATSFQNMPYIGGAAPRSQVTASRVVTANESPPSEKIPFHHEMAQVPNPPGYIFFFCEQAPDTGGATSLLDSASVCEMFFELAPAFAKEVEAGGVRYHRVMPGETDPESAIGRSWRETFQADTRETAEAAMAEAGMEWTWLDNDCVRTSTKVLPAIRTDDDTGRKVFFNSMVAAYTGWNDVRNVGEKAVTSADGTFLPSGPMSELVARMDDMAVNLPWQPGDVLMVNNYTVLHARQSFEGERRVLASIAYR